MNSKGTMSPFEHGEVYVLDDGGEVDLDLGNYERFIDITLTRDNNITTGKIYNHVITKVCPFFFSLTFNSPISSFAGAKRILFRTNRSSSSPHYRCHSRRKIPEETQF